MPSGSILDERLTDKQRLEEPLKEVNARSVLVDVGLDYLAPDRLPAPCPVARPSALPATQIGSRLTEVLYILDEPSIGLYQRDNERFIKSLQARDAGNRHRHRAR